MKAFLSCAAAGLGGACRGPVYLCNNVIRGSVVTRSSLCTFSFSTSPILSSVPISSPPLLLPSLFHHPQSFSLSLIIIQILSLTLVDLRICLMWYWRGEGWNKVESLLFKGEISMIGVLEINLPSLYLRDCRVLCVWDSRRETSCGRASPCPLMLVDTCTLSPVPIKGEKNV